MQDPLSRDALPDSVARGQRRHFRYFLYLDYLYFRHVLLFPSAVPLMRRALPHLALRRDLIKSISAFGVLVPAFDSSEKRVGHIYD